MSYANDGNRAMNEFLKALAAAESVSDGRRQLPGTPSSRPDPAPPAPSGVTFDLAAAQPCWTAPGMAHSVLPYDLPQPAPERSGVLYAAALGSDEAAAFLERHPRYLAGRELEEVLAEVRETLGRPAGLYGGHVPGCGCEHCGRKRRQQAQATADRHELEKAQAAKYLAAREELEETRADARRDKAARARAKAISPGLFGDAAEIMAVLAGPLGLEEEDLPAYEAVLPGHCSGCRLPGTWKAGKCWYCCRLAGLARESSGRPELRPLPGTDGKILVRTPAGEPEGFAHHERENGCCRCECRACRKIRRTRNLVIAWCICCIALCILTAVLPA